MINNSPYIEVIFWSEFLILPAIVSDNYQHFNKKQVQHQKADWLNYLSHIKQKTRHCLKIIFSRNIR